MRTPQNLNIVFQEEEKDRKGLNELVDEIVSELGESEKKTR